MPRLVSLAHPIDPGEAGVHQYVKGRLASAENRGGSRMLVAQATGSFPDRARSHFRSVLIVVAGQALAVKPNEKQLVASQTSGTLRVEGSVHVGQPRLVLRLACLVCAA